MSKRPRSFVDVVELWPSRFDMASEIRTNPERVRKWMERDSIPDDWWLTILSTGTARRAGLTANDLVVLAARERAGASQ